MNQIPANILSLTTEAALLVEKNRISYANPAATELLGPDCLNKHLSDVFGAEFAGVQASSFIGDVPIKGKHYIVRVSKMNFGQIIFFSPSDTAPVYLNDAMVFAANNTLNNLILSIETAYRQMPELGKSILAPLTRNCYSLTRIVSNANIVKSLSENNLVYELKQTDLSLLFGNIIDTVCKLYPCKNFSVDLGENICAPADATLVSKLFLNLISNCLTHTDDSHSVSIHLSEAGETVLLSVSDNGPGIPAAELHCVFDRYRHNFNPLQMAKGSGLGLSVVRGVAELHGGTLLMESRPDVGTCVRVSFSKKDLGKVCIHAPQSAYEGKMRNVLTELADCLSPDCFSEVFFD